MIQSSLYSPRLHILLVLLLLIAGAAWIGLSAAEPGAATSGKIPAPRTGFLAPDFSLQTTAGDPVTLSGLRGSPVIVNVWASWCGPCRLEMPALQNVYAAYQDQGLVVLGLNATSQDSPAAALAFAREMGLTFPILYDEDGRVVDLYQVRAFPTTFFVDGEGIIQDVVVGGPMAEALLRIRAEALLRIRAEALLRVKAEALIGREQTHLPWESQSMFPGKPGLRMARTLVSLREVP